MYIYLNCLKHLYLLLFTRANPNLFSPRQRPKNKLLNAEVIKWTKYHVCFSLNPFFPHVITICLLRTPKSLSVKTIGFQLSIISGTKTPGLGQRSCKAPEQNEWQWGRSAMTRNRTTDFPLSRSIWSCCRLLVCLVLLSKARSPYLSWSGNTLVKNLAASLNLLLHTVPESLLLTPCTTSHCGQLRPTSATFFPLFLKKHAVSFCLWPWSLAPYFSQLEVHGLSPGPFWRLVHRSHSSWEEEAIYPLNSNKRPFAVTAGWKGRLFQAHR